MTKILELGIFKRLYTYKPKYLQTNAIEIFIFSNTCKMNEGSDANKYFMQKRFIDSHKGNCKIVKGRFVLITVEHLQI